MVRLRMVGDERLGFPGFLGGMQKVCRAWMFSWCLGYIGGVRAEQDDLSIICCLGCLRRKSEDTEGGWEMVGWKCCWWHRLVRHVLAVTSMDKRALISVIFCNDIYFRKRDAFQ